MLLVFTRKVINLIKSEVLEIKKQFKENNCTISKICGCYVDSEKNIKTKFSDTFLTLPEEEISKYFEIFKKTLSGTVGKNLLNMEFPRDKEFNNAQNDFLIKLKNTGLKDENLLSELYDNIIETYNYSGNFLILIVHATYDIPGVTSDNIEMEDASDEVYNYLLCSICPVELSKPGLSYQPDENKISQRNRDWIVEMPLNGFLFPAFNDRSTDVNSILYYSKKPSLINSEFIDKFIGCKPPLTADDQKETFIDILEEVLGEECDYESVKNIQEDLNLLIEESKENERSPILHKDEFKSILSENGVKSDRIDIIDNKEELEAGLHLTNLVNSRKFEIKTPTISIKVSPESTDLIDTKIIDGRKSIVIPITEDIELNGVPINISIEK